MERRKLALALVGCFVVAFLFGYYLGWEEGRFESYDVGYADGYHDGYVAGYNAAGREGVTVSVLGPYCIEEKIAAENAIVVVHEDGDFEVYVDTPFDITHFGGCCGGGGVSVLPS
ncbi:MAG: hypothetical protein ACXQTZ_04885 [Candidatus Alkanophagales archaeon]